MHLSFEVVGQPESTQKAIADHPNTPETTLQKLCQYGNRLVRQHAQDNLVSCGLTGAIRETQGIDVNRQVTFATARHNQKPLAR